MMTILGWAFVAVAVCFAVMCCVALVQMTIAMLKGEMK